MPEIRKESEKAADKPETLPLVAEDDKQEEIVEIPASAPAEPRERRETEDEHQKRLGREWSERDRKKMVKSSEFFKKKEHERKDKQKKSSGSIASSRPNTSSIELMTEAAAKVPVGMDEDPELEGFETQPFDVEQDDYHQSGPVVPPLEVTTA